MLLVSYEFLFFLFLSAIVYYLIPKRFQWCLLLLMSYLFYITAGWKSVIFIIITTLSTWWTGMRLSVLTAEGEDHLKACNEDRIQKKEYRLRHKKRMFRLLLAVLLLNFGLLAVLKYTNFAIDNINIGLRLFGRENAYSYVNWILPLGISYYTFQAMGYLIDVYRNKYEAEKNVFHLALFISFFPQLIQGPISQFADMKTEFFRKHSWNKHNIYAGMQRMLWGYMKKLIVADRLSPVITAISQNPDLYRGFYVWIGMISYTIQIYADFSGGIDIVIGAAQLFDIRLPENFERPYFSKSVPEYWRRWHMSLMLWLREYIFYPASVCQPVSRLTGWVKKRFGMGAARRVPVYSASILVWLVVGIWHGATWGYVIWGMIHCVILLISQEMNSWKKRFHQKHQVGAKKWFPVFQIGRTLLILSLVQMLEYYRTVGGMLRMQWSMITELSLSQLQTESFSGLGVSPADWFLVLCGVVLMFGVSLVQRGGSVRRLISEKTVFMQYLIWFGLFLFVLIFGAYGQGYDASQFIYNQF